MPKIRPIIFSSLMVNAIKSGRKTMTRRIINPHQKYEVGDILYVRESFALHTYFNGLTESCIPIFKADYEGPVDWNWKPSIFLPKELSRIWIQITNIKVERLHSITEEDVKSEGVDWHSHEGETYYLIYPPKNPRKALYYGPCTHVSRTTAFFNERPWWHSFASLWNHVHGDQAWETNPFIRALSFKVLSTTFEPTEITSGFTNPKGLKSSPTGQSKELAIEARQLPGNGEKKEVANG